MSESTSAPDDGRRPLCMQIDRIEASNIELMLLSHLPVCVFSLLHSPNSLYQRAKAWDGKDIQVIDSIVHDMYFALERIEHYRDAEWLGIYCAVNCLDPASDRQFFWFLIIKGYLHGYEESFLDFSEQLIETAGDVINYMANMPCGCGREPDECLKLELQELTRLDQWVNMKKEEARTGNAQKKSTESEDDSEVEDQKLGM